ncbi:propionyl-coenzyme A carboxylase alpha polypeptide [Agrobacterium sp. 33MFTa1.1]|nr:propionyl-coenzyme A carboxylase alpha polypeptide [Agrobacterium sp. 33MFTa1.1]
MLMTLAGGAYPPLPCRASPPQGGRSAGGLLFASAGTFKMAERLCYDSISPLEGEMPGRAEGGKPSPPGS